MSITRKVIRSTRKAVEGTANVLTGGNVVDKLSKVQDPKVQRILRAAVRKKGFVSHRGIGKHINRTSNERAKNIYVSERLKTHAARAIAGTALATYAAKKYKDDKLADKNQHRHQYSHAYHYNYR